MKFRILKKSKQSQARLGKISTSHGVINTPAFVPCATNAAVKGAVTPSEIANLGGEALLANTYHLLVREQVDAVKKAGGLAKFMSWPGPTFTDSGGYQVFSLGQRRAEGVGKFANYDEFSTSKDNNIEINGKNSKNQNNKLAAFFRGRENMLIGNQLRVNSSKVKQSRSLVEISDEGVRFNSHLNGKKFNLTPEDSIKVQNQIGADIIFAFDVPTSPITSLGDTRLAMERTHRWAQRCLLFQQEYLKSAAKIMQRSRVNSEHQRARVSRQTAGRVTAIKDSQQALFGIIQGGPYENLRQDSARFIASLDFPGFGIGGSYHRVKGAKRFKELDASLPLLPPEKPRHFLGIGGIDDILIAVRQGIDTFDCVIPTREARHGRIYRFRSRDLMLSSFKKPKYQILNTKFFEIINITNAKYRNNQMPVNNSSLKGFSHAYLHHLFRTQELLGIRLASVNNLEFYFRLMEIIRQEIRKDII